VRRRARCQENISWIADQRLYRSRHVPTSRLPPYTVTATARARGCYISTHFHDRYYADQLVCEQRGSTPFIGSPKMGYAYWERELSSKLGKIPGIGPLAASALLTLL